HPVGFQWVMEAKARGAKIIHVDPRFSRTSALADVHVPIRAGSDIAFLGGIVNYILENGREFRDYVARYPNAGTIIDEGFRDTEDLDGLFSGGDEEKGKEVMDKMQSPDTGAAPQHHAVHYTRRACTIPPLLANLGRPGGALLALRGHASIQGSTDVPTLYNILPAYLPMRHAHSKFALHDYIANVSAPT